MSEAAGRAAAERAAHKRPPRHVGRPKGHSVTRRPAAPTHPFRARPCPWCTALLLHPVASQQPSNIVGAVLPPARLIATRRPGDALLAVGMRVGCLATDPSHHRPGCGPYSPTDFPYPQSHKLADSPKVAPDSNHGLQREQRIEAGQDCTRPVGGVDLAHRRRHELVGSPHIACHQPRPRQPVAATPRRAMVYGPAGLVRPISVYCTEGR